MKIRKVAIMDTGILSNEDIWNFLEEFDEDALDAGVSAFEIKKLISWYDDEYSANEDEEESVGFKEFIGQLRKAQNAGLNIIIFYDK